jgi:fatty-acyl-CoA synthase
MGWLNDETGLEKRAANYVPLTPLSHLTRAAKIFPDHEAMVYQGHRTNYREYHMRISQFASELVNLGIKPGDVVATILPNIPAQAEAHFAIPAIGAIINTINIRLESSTVSYILDHGEARIILVDTQFIPLVEEAVEKMEGIAPKLIEVADAKAGYPATGRYPEYEDLILSGDSDFEWLMPQDEWESLALNYTSGTTGRPKGVVVHHRGAYLLSMGTVISWRMVLHPRLLTIVPLFHCNGWGQTWMMPALGGTLIFCRDVTAKAIYDAIADENVTHFGGAPIVLNAIINAAEANRRDFDHTVEIFTAGAPPAGAILNAIQKLGFNVTQVYGLTETYGPITECNWRDEWKNLPNDDQVAIKARQGVAFPVVEHVTVFDNNLKQIPLDSKTPGEIVMRGNTIMKGYLKNPKATETAFAGGYFHSEDIAVQHSDGYIQIVDRAKDIIISGGENVSSVEVENALMNHPAISLCAVVAKPDAKWGEVPCAFVELKHEQSATEAEIISFVREKLAGFKTPKSVIFRELPKTSTGKIQKFDLRAAAKKL